MTDIQNQILALTGQPTAPEAIYEALLAEGIELDRKALADELETLVADARLMRSKKNRYGHPACFGYSAGTFCATGRSFAFVRPDDLPEDIFIPPHMGGNAWHGDRVLVHLDPNPRDSGKPEGKVVRILARSKDELYGALYQSHAAIVFRADSDKYPEISIPKKHLDGAHPGDRVAVRVLFWGDKKYLPQGTVTKIFGSALTIEAVSESILHQNGIDPAFPDEALRQADTYPPFLQEKDFAGRIDLRELQLFTVDGDTSKDFDDAVSLTTLPNGHYQLGVHIADVSHYVQPNTPLDREAFKRGTSVYYADKVVPMLPFQLSNGICSLNPGVNRLAFSVFLELGEDGTVFSTDFHKTVIRSCARLTYNEVNLVFSGDEQARTARRDLTATLDSMNRLAHILRVARMRRGALDLEIPESVICCDRYGKVTDVQRRDRGDAEKMIEEFMLAANEAVAEFMFHAQYPTVYRIHEQPDPAKLEIFARAAGRFGYRLKRNQLVKSTRAMQMVLDEAADKPEQRSLPTMLLRSLARARYSPDCVGHYGLASKFYLHFTSPIRRYPDLMVHRMLEKLLTGQPSDANDEALCETAARQSSEREIAADTAERDIEKLYFAEYMSQYVGHTFDAMVSGVTNFGIFVQLPNLIEGMIRLDTLGGDEYDFDEDFMTLRGRHTGQAFYIGLNVNVTLVHASGTTGQIDFILTPPEDAAG